MRFFEVDRMWISIFIVNLGVERRVDLQGSCGVFTIRGTRVSDGRVQGEGWGGVEG